MRSHERLETLWSNYNHLDPKGMVACSSGTSALHLAMEVCRATKMIWGDESTLDEVITNDFSIIACPRAISLAGLRPVFVDCDSDLLMNFDCFIKAKGRSSRAVLAVHIYGRVNPMVQIVAESEARGFFVIEDLAEAHSVSICPGTDAACWSFYSNKIVAGEEGGAVWFRNPDHAKLARQLRSLGFTDVHDFIHTPRGHNYRLADSLANLIIDSLGKVHGNLDRRRENVMIYDRICPSQWKMPPREVPWVYDLRLHGIGTLKQTEIVKKLNEAGIQARFSFKPCHRQEEFKDCRIVSDNLACGTNSLWASTEVIYLPCHPKVTGTEINKAFEIIQREMEGFNPLR